MDKSKMIRNFSRSARFYDDYADAQRLSALKLLSQLGLRRFQNILEIGCGTGSYSYLLRKKFDQALLKSVDISEKMIEVAREKLKGEKIEFIVGDAECMDLGSGYDLITSNACFQWFENVQRAVIRYREMLKKDGQISFSIFGPGTFSELNTSLRSSGHGARILAAHFITKGRLLAFITRSLTLVWVQCL